MGETGNQGLCDPVAQIVCIGVCTHVGEWQHGNRINWRSSAGLQVPSATCCQCEDDAGGECNPERAPFERSHGRCLCSNYFGGLEISFKPLQVGAKFGGALITQVAVFLQSFVDDVFEHSWQGGIQPH